LDLLVDRKLLGPGQYQKEGGSRSFAAYAIHPKLFNGLTMTEAFDSDAWQSLPKPPAFDASKAFAVEPPPPPPPTPPAPKPKPKPEPKLVPKPAPAPTPPKPAPAPTPARKSNTFADTLLMQAAQDQDLVDQLVDMYIMSERFDKLAETVVKSSDKAACEKILRRVAELSQQKD
jgi:outer membrane biosynthesis protein TonB